jgi:hypothetical protein
MVREGVAVVTVDAGEEDRVLAMELRAFSLAEVKSPE